MHLEAAENVEELIEIAKVPESNMRKSVREVLVTSQSEELQAFQMQKAFRVFVLKRAFLTGPKTDVTPGQF